MEGHVNVSEHNKYSVNFVNKKKKSSWHYCLSFVKECMIFKNFITLCDYYKHNTVKVIIILWKVEWFF